MNEYVISIEKNLTSYVFYNQILKELHNYYRQDERRELVFDLSMVKTIEPLVIPNLLCVAYIIKSNSNIIPYFFISNNYESRFIKRYLYDIEFINLSKKFNLFSFPNTIIDGMIESHMDDLNTTMYFPYEEPEELAWTRLSSKVNRFSQKYLNNFNVDSINIQRNIVVDLCNEIIKNSKKHGRSFAFMTMQYNYLREKIYISISDCGIGFKESFNNRIAEENERNEEVQDELAGIIKGIYRRANSKVYGLYNVIKRVLAIGGTIRIHSMETQLILTPKLNLHMDIASSEEILSQIIDKPSLKHNIRSDLKYGGVHIEMEIPLSMSKTTGGKRI